ncbi:hypothetical protein SAMD00019534_066790 [Acytostelium subglobosum LB1]|uniref:hypothetical protein n=1 Tax=Acytostelium subglobosum LB1 TaxID=1410327 RepID=UPI000644F18F|nr:hypothetical protein SAMD00019534_066790 [Acytostelium subglobosum LB1]GAM23504.1 hypothetical protein SAMD00019534_066790 [Acytostelium subglobosum LB1]|eukprot:XP_012753245.1 hypothetical protein SAMD00019534_066790 [Acytostelium subglobosum LB1]
MSDTSNAAKKELPFFFGDSNDNDDKRLNDSGDEKFSADEADDDAGSDLEDFIPPPSDTMDAMPQQIMNRAGRGGGNTGVKGVLADYAEHQEKKRQEFVMDKELRKQMVQKMAVTVKDNPANQQQQQQQEEEDEEDEDLKRLKEQRLAQFRKQQQQHQHPAMPKNKTFGFLKQINKKEYVEEIDNEPPHVFVIVHLYQNYIPECIALNQHLSQLAIKYRHIKFLKILSTEAKADYHDEALPSLLVYIGGNLLVSFIPITEDLERNFVKEDLELLLASYDIIPQPKAERWETSLSQNRGGNNNISGTYINTASGRGGDHGSDDSDRDDSD